MRSVLSANLDLRTKKGSTRHYGVPFTTLKHFQTVHLPDTAAVYCDSEASAAQRAIYILQMQVTTDYKPAYTATIEDCRLLTWPSDQVYFRRQCSVATSYRWLSLSYCYPSHRPSLNAAPTVEPRRYAKNGSSKVRCSTVVFLLKIHFQEHVGRQ